MVLRHWTPVCRSVQTLHSKALHKVASVLAFLLKKSFWWWRNPESNWGHKDFQSSALPTELFRQITKRYKNRTLPKRVNG